MDWVAFIAGAGVAVAMMVVLFLVTYRRARHRAAADRAQDGAHALVCTVCTDRGFESRGEAIDHCKDVHNAPSESAAMHLLAPATVSEGSA